MINVPLGVTLADVLVSSPLIAEEGMPAMGGGGGDFEFGVDPSQDPELASRRLLPPPEGRLESQPSDAGPPSVEVFTGSQISIFAPAALLSEALCCW